jgi:hypothetical protein
VKAMASAALRHSDTPPRVKPKRSTQYSLKIKRNVYLVFDTSKGLVLGDAAVAACPGRPPIRGKVEAASPRSIVMVLRGGKKRRLSRSVWSVGPVVATQYVRDI